MSGDHGPSMGEYEEAYGVMDASEEDGLHEEIAEYEKVYGAIWMTPAAALATWHSQNGRVTTIADLNDRHLVNIIRLLRKKASVGQQAEIEYLTYAPNNTDASVITRLVHLKCISSEAWLREAEPRYEIMLAEAFKRGLET